MDHLVRFLLKEKRAIMSRIAVDQSYPSKSDSKLEKDRLKLEIELNLKLLKEIDRGLVILKKQK